LKLVTFLVSYDYIIGNCNDTWRLTLSACSVK